MGIFKNWFKKISKDSSDGRTSQGTLPMPSASPVTKTIMPRSLRPVSLAVEGEPQPQPVAAPGPVVPLPDKEILFTLGDFADRIPPGVLKTGRLDLQRQITFHSRDLYSDLTRGKASVSLSKLAEVCPEIFERPEALAGDESSIHLPLQKLVEQIGEFHFRPDQQQVETPAHIYETPFLKGVLQDGGRAVISAPSSLSAAVPHPSQTQGMLPKSTPTVRTSGAPGESPRSTVPIIPPGMRPPPATVRASVSGGKIKIGPPSNHSTESKDEEPPQKSIPFPQTSTGDTGGGSIPLPTRKVTVSGIKLPSSLPNVAGGAPHLPPQPAPSLETMVLSGNVQLNLASVLRSLPAYLLNGDASGVDSNATIEFPIALVQPQIRTGKVLVPVATFQSALPDHYRALINAQEADSGVPLPLRDIVSALPQSVLQHRGDQVRQEVHEEIPTPFSDKAREDAARLQTEAEHTETQDEHEPVAEEVASTDPEAAHEVAAEEPQAEPIAEQAETSPSEADEESLQAEEIHEEESTPAPEEHPASGRQIRLSEAEAAALDIPLPASQPAAEAPAPLAMPVAASTAIPTAGRPPKPFIKTEIVTPGEVSEEDIAVAVKPAPVTINVPAATPEAAPEPVEAPTQEDEPAPLTTEVAPAKSSQAAEAAAALQQMFMTDEALDARKIATLTAELPGLGSAIICTADGLRLASAGSIEALDSLSAISPHFFQRTAGFVTELKLGQLKSFTVDTEKGFVSLFRSGTISMVVKHGTRELMPGVRGRLSNITTQLNRMYGDSQNA